jgi:hypothetical protein
LGFLTHSVASRKSTIASFTFPSHSRSSHAITRGGYRSDESKWPEIQDAMVDAMIRLEQAVRPEIAKQRFGR